jgi:TPR repeat protein
MAVEYYEMATAQGHAKAQCRLGVLYYTGLYGVPQDIKKAVEYFNMAAAQGHAKP